MRDIYLCVLGGWVVAAYLIYMVFEGGDGVIFGSVMAVIGALAGMKIEKRWGVRPDDEPADD